MRVLVVTNMLPTAANPRAGTFVEQQIQSLNDAGLDVGVLLLDRATRGMAVYRNTGRLVRERCREMRPDVMHIMYGGAMACLATRAVRDVARVVSFCGTDLLGEESGPVSLRLRAAFGVVCSWRAARRAERIVVKSRSLGRSLPAAIDRKIVSVIPNGVSFERFAPRDRGACCAELGWDPATFHVAFSMLHLGDTNKRLPLAQAAVAKLEAHGVAAELHVMLDVAHDRVPVWLNAANAVLVTSMHEGSPNIVKEGLACNRPVVGVDVGDVAERLEGIDGCYVGLPDADDLADQLRMVDAGPGSVRGREAIQDLSLEHVAGQLVAVYEDAVRHSRS